MKRLLLLIVWCASAFASPALAGQTQRFFGTAATTGQAAFPLYAELNNEGDAVTGTFTIPGGLYNVEGRTDLSGVTAGSIKGDGATGTFSFRITNTGVSGTFVLGGAPGTLELSRTTKTRDEALGPPPQRSALSVKEWREDLAALNKIIIEHHGAPFHRISKAAYLREAAALDARLPTLQGPRVAAEFRRLAALIGDGHTGVLLFRGQPRYPFHFWWFADGLRVVETDADHRALLGAKLVAIGETGTSALLQRFRAFSARGENEAYFQSLAPTLINRPEMLEAIGVSAEASRRWSFQPTSGGRTVVAVAPRIVAPKEWAQLGGQRPLWARAPDEPFWSEYWAESRTLYANFRSYDNLEVNTATLLRDADARRPERLILDMRDNGGGDYEKGRAVLIAEITRRPWLNTRGHLFVLAGRDTFSAAMVNAADFKSSTSAILVGEPIGETPNSWQEPRRYYLPNSGLAVNVSTSYYAFAPRGTDSIVPMLNAPPDWRDWMRGEDSAIKAILKLTTPRPVRVRT